MIGSAVTYVTRGCTSRATLGHSKRSWDRSGSMLSETGAPSHVSSALRSKRNLERRSEESECTILHRTRCNAICEYIDVVPPSCLSCASPENIGTKLFVV